MVVVLGLLEGLGLAHGSGEGDVGGLGERAT
jgi:hypothetical protein